MISHNGFNYSFNYDNFGNVTQTKVGTQVLSTNSSSCNVDIFFNMALEEEKGWEGAGDRHSIGFYSVSLTLSN